ncbi:MAG: MBL fold metallo-hydrolase [Bacteroidia bacterium]
MKIKFLGTGTSQGVPVIACGCEVCQSTDERDARLRSSILVEIDNKVFVIDTGPDFRQQMLRAKADRLDAVIYTHAHKDHIAGMDDVRPFNFAQKRDMDVYATEDVQTALKREFFYAFEAVKYPGVPMITLHTIQNKKFDIAGISIQPIQVWHHKMPVLGFRFGDFAYVTDANRISDEELLKLKGLNVLVLNALRRESHISHFNLNQAIDLIKLLQPKTAYLTHISHQLGKHVDVESELPTNIRLAYDGLEISL